MKHLLLLTLFLTFGSCIHAQKVLGKVSAEDGESLPFVNISVKGSPKGVASDSNGEFILPLSPGHYTLVFTFVGYVTHEEAIAMERDKDQTLQVVMKPSAQELGMAVIVADSRDFAKEIMEQVRDKRKDFLEARGDFSYQTYAKVGLKSERLEFEIPDSVKTDPVRFEAFMSNTDSLLDRRQDKIIEYIAEVKLKAPGNYQLQFAAYEDHTVVKKYAGQSVSISVDLDRGDLAPVRVGASNSYLVYEDVASAAFDFYRSYIQFDRIADRPLLSPIGAGSALSYRYDYLQTFTDGTKSYHRLKVEPLFAEQPLFRGEIVVQDSTWALASVDLSLAAAGIRYCDTFRVQQSYVEALPNIWFPQRRELSYTIKSGGRKYQGYAQENNSAFQTFPQGIPAFERGAQRIFADDAQDRDSEFWLEKRPATLTYDELAFIHKADSTSAYFESDEWYAKRDSAFNKITWWTPLIGIGHRNTKRGTEWYLGGILEQVNPLGVGGYRHRLPGHVYFDRGNHDRVEIDGFLDYGFANTDFRGKLGLGYTWNPTKFYRTKVTLGDYYDIINPFASVEQLFSRGNYARTQNLALSQRMELKNGLFAEVSFDFAKQSEIDSVYLRNDITNPIFGELNEPIGFETYVKSELRIDVEYHLGQQYMIKNGKKYILGNDRPTFGAVMRLGIPQLFGSEVDFTYLEASLTDNRDIGRLGRNKWKVVAGSFVRKPSLRVLEHRFFRGSDRIFFSDPSWSFQLLQQRILSTPNLFVKTNIIHHFEGFFLDKVPLINKLKLMTAVGAGAIAMPEDDFYHSELFAGLEKDVRIGEQMLRFGVYGVTASNSLVKQDLTFKIGVNFFNSFTNKWDY